MDSSSQLSTQTAKENIIIATIFLVVLNDNDLIRIGPVSSHYVNNMFYKYYMEYLFEKDY